MNKLLVLNIITVVWNDIDGLRRTLKSLLKISNEERGIILKINIQDGLSNDGTKEYAQEFINKNQSEKLNINLRSERDDGIFDAMNKASANFKDGDLILYLNAGDIISKEINSKDLQNALLQFQSENSYICGFRSKNTFENLNYHMPSKKVINSEQYFKWLKNNTPVHQALIFKYDENFPIHYPVNFKIQADSIMIYYLIKYQAKPLFINMTLCEFELEWLNNSYKSFSKVYTQIKEQKIVSKLRDEEKLIIFIRTISLLIKFILHNILGKNFYKFHALLKKITA